MKITGRTPFDGGAGGSVMCAQPDDWPYRSLVSNEYTIEKASWPKIELSDESLRQVYSLNVSSSAAVSDEAFIRERYSSCLQQINTPNSDEKAYVENGETETSSINVFIIIVPLILIFIGCLYIYRQRVKETSLWLISTVTGHRKSENESEKNVKYLELEEQQPFSLG